MLAELSAPINLQISGVTHIYRVRSGVMGRPTPNLLIRSQMLYPLSYGRRHLQLYVADESAAAEARGFEPPVPCKGDNSLAVSPIRPLWHASRTI